MRRHLPSLGALRAFEAAARYLSFTRAAEELNLTQSAISRQIRTLEELLGFELFHRLRQRLILTPAGTAYLPDIQACLDRIETATANLVSSQSTRRALNIDIPATFGAKWLMPRLPTFVRAYPEVTLNFATRSSPIDFDAENIDAAIHFGEAAWPRAASDRLMSEDVVVACSPTLAAEADLRSPGDVLRCTLLHQTSRPRAWTDWLDAAGVPYGNNLHGPRFEQIELVIRAAVAGLGVAVLPRSLIADDLEAGRLVMPFTFQLRSTQAYWLVYPLAKRDMAELKAFRQWLLGEANADAALV